MDYELIEEVLADGDIPVKYYKNKVTGLKVFHAFVECPIVKGDMVFATEAHDDDGLPHTLEHLVFMGSETYPYKGILDLLANKCFASGTNAYTDIDHTNYTVSTAGSEGFLTLLPVYLDHLLFPTLTDSAYVTEVHHINGKGEDAGVVYCEMQARENSGEARCYIEMLRELYPGNSGYKSETGGLMKNIRESTNVDKCRDYHKAFYHTKNLGLIVCGPVTPEELFKAIEPIDAKIAKQLKENPRTDFTRPWSTPVEPLNESPTKRIQYISDTDDDGLVYIGFRGPEVAKDHRTLVALSLVLEYLNSTSIAPIQRDFVECPKPLCSSVTHIMVDNSTSCFYLAFESVGKDYLDHVAHQLYQTLNGIVRGRESFDMQRMGDILSRQIVRLLSAAETSPHSIINGPIIGHFLYGTDDLKERCQKIPLMKELTKQDAQFWLDLIDKYMIGPDARHVCIVGEPSPELMKSMAQDEKARIAKQKEDLKDSLADLGAKLKQSVDTNELPAPSSLLNSFKTPTPDNIKFHQVERVVPDRPAGTIDATPFRFQYDSIKTNFVSIYLLMNTSYGLTKYDRLYLPLLTELLLECPIMRNGRQVCYETVVAELFRDTITYGSSIGLSSGASLSVGALSMLFGLAMQVEVEKYEKAVQWCTELLYRIVFTPERIRTIATRMISDISQSKRSGSKVLSASMNALTYQSNSNQWAANFMRQQKFLKNLLKDTEAAAKEIMRIKDIMAQPTNILVHVSLNKEKLDPEVAYKPWIDMIPEEVVDRGSIGHISFKSVILCNELLEFAEEPKAAIVGVGSVESNFLQQVVKSIDSPEHPDLPALYVLIQYLTQLEGPLWRQIRGLGLSYHYSIHNSPFDGTLKFLLYKSTQLVEAYKKSQEIVNSYVDGKEEYDNFLFEAAKSSLIFEFIKSEKSAASKSMQSLVCHIRGLDINYNQEIIKKVAAVTIDDIKRVGPLYLKSIFEDEERRTVVCCNPSKIAKVTKGLEESAGCQLEEINLEEEPLLNQFYDSDYEEEQEEEQETEAEEEEDDDDDEDEDDEDEA